MIKKQFRITIIGDSMLDAYVTGHHKGKSPEADVAVLLEQSRDYRLGGAANVAMNLRAMQAKPSLISMAGSDSEASILRKLLRTNQIKHELLIDLKRPTSLKTRFVDKDYTQYLRLDRESTKPLNKSQESQMIEILEKQIKSTRTEAVIIQDYNKGFLTKKLIRFIQKKCEAESLPLLVDPKHAHFELLSRSDVFKPNLKESLHYLESAQLDPEKVCEQVSRALPNPKRLIITLGDKGIFAREGSEKIWSDAYKVKNPDVSGAGDSVIAAICIFLLNGCSLQELVHYANIAGAISCSKAGVSPVSLNEIKAFKKKMKIS